MKINVNNTEKLEAVLDKVQNRCSTRLVSVTTIQCRAEQLEERLSNMLFKKDMMGVEFLINDNAQNFANAYRGTPESTQYVLTRGASGWFVTLLNRSQCKNTEVEPLNLHNYGAQLADYASNNKNWN